MKKLILVFSLFGFHNYLNIAVCQKIETMRRELTLENYVPRTPITLYKDFLKIENKDVPENTILSMPNQIRYLYNGEEKFSYMDASVLHLMLITDLQGKLMAVIAVCQFDSNILKRLIEHFGIWRVASGGELFGKRENHDELPWYTWYLKENYVTLNQKRFVYPTFIYECDYAIIAYGNKDYVIPEIGVK